MKVFNVNREDVENFNLRTSIRLIFHEVKPIDKEGIIHSSNDVFLKNDVLSKVEEVYGFESVQYKYFQSIKENYLKIELHNNI